MFQKIGYPQVQPGMLPQRMLPLMNQAAYDPNMPPSGFPPPRYIVPKVAYAPDMPPGGFPPAPYIPGEDVASNIPSYTGHPVIDRYIHNFIG